MGKVYSCVFSPTNTSDRYAAKVTQNVGSVEKINLLNFNTRWQKRTFEKDDFVFFAFPVYGGRLPCVVDEVFRNFSGSGTPCALVLTYAGKGNETAVQEFCAAAEKSGFVPVACGCFISDTVLADKEDAYRQADEFGQQCLQTAKQKKTGVVLPFAETLPKRFDGDFTLGVDDDCNMCGACVKVCPLKAIDPNDAKKTDGLRCIVCGRCIALCPKKARYFGRPNTEKDKPKESKILEGVTAVKIYR